MNSLKLAVVLILVFVRTAWSVEPKKVEITSDAKAVAEGNNQFATDLYARLRSDKPTNLFFSPYSISMALAMTYAGAEGQTEQQMAAVLKFPLPETKLHPAYNTLRQAFNSQGESPGFQLRVTNRLWGQQGSQFLPDFVQVTKENYGAELGLVDFSQQAEMARKTINAWVEEQTEHKIMDLLAPGVLDSTTRLVLTNAIYFKARWLHEFSQGATSDAPFHISPTQQVTVPMMYQSHRFSYGVFDDVQVLELPYGFGNLSMLILLPKSRDGLTNLEKNLTSANLQKWSSSLQSRMAKVYLPKFKMSSEFSLKDVLESMGMKLAFSKMADFSGMSTEEQLFISAVIHKAFVDVNEEGTEAAAATAVGMAASAMPRPEEPVEFRADHPFVFLLREYQSESILFMGRVVNPKE